MPFGLTVRWLNEMNDTQKQTIQRYQGFLEAFALSSSLDVAIRVGLMDTLRDGQKNIHQLAAKCECDPTALESLLQVLVSLGAIEQYRDDFALSPAAQLLVGPDADLGTAVWRELPEFLRGNGDRRIDREIYRRRLSARQWSHTAAAMQAAEVLDIGGGLRGLNVLELGSGAGVWSAAMAYRDSKLRVTCIDMASGLAQCQATYASIDLLDQCRFVEDDYRTWSTPLGEFDLVILPEVLQLEDDSAAVILLGRAADALREGGQVAIFEALHESDGPPLQLAIHALEVAVASGGQQRSVAQIEGLLRGAGFRHAQWGWLTASNRGIGLVVANKS